MAQFPESEYCTFIHPDGRKCRALKMPTRNVCIGHWRSDGQFEQDEAALIELAAVSRNLDSRRGVRKALVSLFRLIATDRIPPRKAALLLYNGQLLLMSFAPARHETEEAAVPGGQELLEGTLPELAGESPGKSKPNGSGSPTAD